MMMKKSTIIDGLSTVILFNVFIFKIHIQEAFRDLKRFCSEAPAIPFTILCDSFQITKRLISRFSPDLGKIRYE